MGSRGRFYPGPQRGWGEPYDMPPPPQHGRGYYDDFNQPPDRYFDHPPPPPQYQNDRPPPHMNNSRGRGRGRGQNSNGRGQSRGRGMRHNLNGPKKAPIQEEKKIDSKPAWLSTSTNNTADSTASNKPAWLAQSVTTTSASGSETSPSKPAWMTQGSTSTSTSNSDTTTSKPAWLLQASTSTSVSDTNTLKPAWLTQSSTSTSTSNSDSKPSWLNQVVTSSVSSSSKPSWLNTTVSTTVTPNTSTNTPSWLYQSNNITNSKPSWLTQSSIPQTSNDTLPPPPPPATPPPPNQPKIQQPFTGSPFLNTATATGRPKRKIKDDKEVQGSVALPGQGNFISFKNSLQEYCQKKGFGVPSYKSFKKSFGYSATVDIYSGQIQSTGIQKDKKEAEQHAAYQALKVIGLLGQEAPFKVTVKRHMPSPQAVAKKLKTDLSLNLNYKCQLNEFCQKFHLDAPVYETTSSGSGYVTKLLYNKKEYLSSVQPTKKAAELYAAQLVLSKVNQAPPPSEKPAIYPNFIPAAINPMGSGSTVASSAQSTSAQSTSAQSANDTQTQPTDTNTTPIHSIQDLVSQNITPVISYKNQLQEVCQKLKVSLPVYKNTKDAHLHCCELIVQGQTFNSTGCKTKKAAEQSAARIALEGLGLL